jgi:hypothetical protein
MSAKPFQPKCMQLSILTAALQELTPRAVRDADPDRAVEEWLAFAKDIGSPNVQLSAALHPSESDIPAEAHARSRRQYARLTGSASPRQRAARVHSRP